MSIDKFFASDYFTARRRFCDAVARYGWQQQAWPIAARGPNGEELTIDAAVSNANDTSPALILSNGLHGVEGFFGSAVQLAFLHETQLLESIGSKIRLFLLHALNPYGFCYSRRFNEDNVDLNRNFLCADEPYEGCPPQYRDLDALLNPRKPPSRFDPFLPRALWHIFRHGMPALKQSVAGGQYEFPRGLFFGGDRPSRTMQLLDEELAPCLAGSPRAIHLDFHTGLGRWATWKMLIDEPLSEERRHSLENCFGAENIETGNPEGVAYATRGGLGRWCRRRYSALDYVFCCTEFGTFSPLKILTGLRAENQAHHWGNPDDASTQRAKRRLRELFCPTSQQWRRRVIAESLHIIRMAAKALLDGIQKQSLS